MNTHRFEDIYPGVAKYDRYGATPEWVAYCARIAAAYDGTKEAAIGKRGPRGGYGFRPAQNAGKEAGIDGADPKTLAHDSGV